MKLEDRKRLHGEEDPEAPALRDHRKGEIGPVVHLAGDRRLRRAVETTSDDHDIRREIGSGAQEEIAVDDVDAPPDPSLDPDGGLQDQKVTFDRLVRGEDRVPGPQRVGSVEKRREALVDLLSRARLEADVRRPRFLLARLYVPLLADE